MKNLLLALFLLFAFTTNSQTYKTVIDTTFLESVSPDDFDTIHLDLNADGLDDVTFQYQNKPPGSGVMKVHVGSYSDNFVSCPGYIDVTVFNDGSSIDSTSPGWKNEKNDFDPWGFFNDARMIYKFWGGGNINGNFANATKKFVGVKFLNASGDTFYGYVEISNDVGSFPGFFTIHSYGYNSVPDSPVIAGTGMTITSTKELYDSKNVEIYPTIVVDRLSIKTTNDHPNNYSISIVNSAGLIVQEFTSNQSDYNYLDLSFLQKGIYFILLRGDDFSLCRRVVKI